MNNGCFFENLPGGNAKQTVCRPDWSPESFLWRASQKRVLTLLVLPLLFCIVGLSGCSELQTDYGRSVGSPGKKSIAGFGVLREFYRQNGWRDRTLTRLSERLNNVDTIIWTPDASAPLSNEATLWFEAWLARGDKTLVYVIKDHRTEYEYWKRASRLAPPSQRLEYRRRLARAKLELDRQLLARPALITNGWFTAVPLTLPAVVSDLAGPWSESLTGFQSTPEIEFRVLPYDQTKNAPGATTGPPAVVAPFGAQLNYQPSDLEVDFDVLLKNQGDVPIVSEITFDRWNNSQILVVSAGSLLTNFGLTDQGSRQLAGSIMEASSTGNDGDIPKVGFLASGQLGVSVSSLDPENMGPSGMEMFTEPPLNMVTIHGAILILLVCLMLFPIFGRPRRIPPRPSADFTAHIDAVAGLMERTGGEQYARVRISEYMVRVRGETDSKWVIKQRETVPISETPIAPQQASPRQQASTAELPDAQSDVQKNNRVT